MTLRTQIYTFKSILIQFLLNHTAFCVLLPIFYYTLISNYAKVADFEDIFFFKLINRSFLIPFYVSL